MTIHAAQQGDIGVMHTAATAYPVSVAAATLFGLPLESWVYITAILSALLTMAYTSWKWVRDWRNGKVSLPKPTVPPNR